MSRFVGVDEPGALLLVPVGSQSLECLLDGIGVAGERHVRGRRGRLFEGVRQRGEGVGSGHPRRGRFDDWLMIHQGLGLCCLLGSDTPDSVGTVPDGPQVFELCAHRKGITGEGYPRRLWLFLGIGHDSRL